MLSRICLIALVLGSLAGAARGGEPTAEEAAILARIVPPKFPDKDFPITAYGGVADGDASQAIAQAIAACVEAGGGRVVVPAGRWRTGAIRLASNVNLHVAAGATLVFDPDPARY
jgi:unsaturated rhamnogalacturonyl hydrolase